MTDNVENLVLELLRAIRADIADLRREVTNNTVQIVALGQQMAGLSIAAYGGKNDLEEVKRGVERLDNGLNFTMQHEPFNRQTDMFHMKPSSPVAPSTAHRRRLVPRGTIAAHRSFNRSSESVGSCGTIAVRRAFSL